MSKPNVLVFCVDHWPASLCEPAGHEVVHTPTIRQLSENGVRFSNAYTQTPTCIPSRRGFMTGTTAQTHGDRVFNEHLRMDPDLTTLPQAFRNAGYQAYAVGKLHVYPQRDRIGFDEVILCEEGRDYLGMRKDDFEMFLSDQGFNGQELTHALSNNEYTVRGWHLPEYCHPTNWTTREMCRTIIRRNPDKPAFWYCSYIGPHPPVTPPREYLDMYPTSAIDDPYIGEWAQDDQGLPYALKEHHVRKPAPQQKEQVRRGRAGFYAQCTYIDHQMRLVIGTLREEGLLDDTIIVFLSDHGDMLGNHNLWAKPPMFEDSVNVPLIIVPTSSYGDFSHHQVEDRLVYLHDVMPTLLEMCGVPVPESVEGISLLSDQRRKHLYAEHYEDQHAMRMVRDERYKLIYYAAGNRKQLFDLHDDPREMVDLSESESHAEIMRNLTSLLIS
ncbi:sulfatase-like hydrolase/transferase, partial [candidate division GN15 bacterium]|nr:sulfatase-like hydrolase/transferase [candidate division GN15 bacterium]